MHLLNILNRWGPRKLRLLTTLACIVTSMAIMVVIDIVLRGYIDPIDVTIAAIIPTLVAWPVVGLYINLLTQLQQTEARLLTLAHEDGLTRLLNRRRFLELAELEWRSAQRAQLPLTVLILDVDHFKRVNDTYGHPAGDAVLQHLALVLRGELRSSDLIARYGGEEFAMLLPGSDAAHGRAVAERVLASLAASPLTTPRGPVACSASIGMAASSPGCPSLEALLIAADNALYQAKHDGRNRVAAALCDARWPAPPLPGDSAAP